MSFFDLIIVLRLKEGGPPLNCWVILIKPPSYTITLGLPAFILSASLYLILLGQTPEEKQTGIFVLLLFFFYRSVCIYEHRG